MLELNVTVDRRLIALGALLNKAFSTTEAILFQVEEDDSIEAEKFRQKISFIMYDLKTAIENFNECKEEVKRKY